jgi:hypothetical protein
MRAVFFLLLQHLVNGYAQEVSHDVPDDPDVGKDMISIVSDMGYIIEQHYVTTSDGYILTMFRIPHGKFSNVTGPPVILQVKISIP